MGEDDVLRQRQKKIEKVTPFYRRYYKWVEFISDRLEGFERYTPLENRHSYGYTRPQD